MCLTAYAISEKIDQHSHIPSSQSVPDLCIDLSSSMDCKMRIAKFYSNKLNSHMFVYLTDVSVKINIPRLAASIALGHPLMSPMYRGSRAKYILQ